MMDDMEDGELPDSPTSALDDDQATNEAIDAPYRPLLRPEAVKQTIPSLTRPRSATNSSTVANMGDLSDFDDASRPYDPSASNSSSPKTSLQVGGDSDSDNDTAAARILRGLPGSSSENDSDSDNGCGGKPNRKMKRTNDHLKESKVSGGGDTFRQMAAQFQLSRSSTAFQTIQQQQQHLKKKTNNVWGKVLTEETLTSDMTGIGVGRRSMKDIGCDRGAESYDFITAQEIAAKEPKPDKRDPIRSSLDQDLDTYWKTKNPAEGYENAQQGDSGSMETEDDRRKGAIRAGKKRSVKDRLGRRPERRTNHHEGEIERGQSHLDNMSIPQPGVSRNIPDISPGILLMLSESKNDAAKNENECDAMENEGEVSDTEDAKTSALGEEIALKLCEPKTELMTGVVEIVGTAVALELFEKTRKIEQDGGMMIKNGLRRRTPGGVFLHLLRELGTSGNDPRFDPKQIKKFFAGSNNGQHYKLNQRQKHKHHMRASENYQSDLEAFQKLKQKGTKKREAKSKKEDSNLKPLPDILSFVGNAKERYPSGVDEEDNRPPDVPPNSVEPIERTLSVYEDDFLSVDADDIELF